MTGQKNREAASTARQRVGMPGQKKKEAASREQNQGGMTDQKHREDEIAGGLIPAHRRVPIHKRVQPRCAAACATTYKVSS